LRKPFAGFAVFALLLGFWAVSWTSVAALLQEASADRLARWSGGLALHEWQFAHPAALVLPGSTGLDSNRSDSESLVGTIPDGNADLSLNLREQRLDLAVLDRAEVQIQVAADARISLLAQARTEPDVAIIEIGTAALKPGESIATIALKPGLDATATALRLHVETAPETRLTLHALRLFPVPGLGPRACPLGDDAAACAMRVPIVTSPLFTSVESLLHWRDALLRARPEAIVQVRSPLPAPARAIELTRRVLAGNVGWFLMALPILTLALSLRGARERTPLRACGELIGVFGPWLVLQWAGIDPDWQSSGPAFLAYWCALVAAILLRDPTPDWSFAGRSEAWRATLPLALIGTGVILASAGANALDNEGFEWRRIETDMFWRYPLWALLQQWILMRAIAPRVGAMCQSRTAAALAVGALFGLLHLPNFGLMVATLAAGSAWAWLGFRHRALLPLAVSHVLLGLALFAVAPPWLLRSAEIGARFLMLP
jgi:hypothetical protein